MSKVEVDKVIPQSGTTLTIGDSGDTINLVGTLQSNGSPLPGDISSVVAGTGLSGGGTSGAVTLNIDSAQSTITSLGTLTSATISGDLTVDTNTLFVDASANRVGIGTSAPDSPLDILTSGNSGLEVNAGTGSAHRIYLGNTGGTSVVGTLSNHAFATITNGSERARIDTNGNLMVGKTSVDTSTSGVEFRSDGLVGASRASNPPLLLNRRTDDGNVVLIRKDNSNIGFIGVKSSNVFMSSNTNNNTGFKINPNAITPSTYQGLDRDNAIDLGSSSSRYKDLWLGGKAYVGSDVVISNNNALIINDTSSAKEILKVDNLNQTILKNANDSRDIIVRNASDADIVRFRPNGGIAIGGSGDANTLDDYEEGTWTPIYRCTGNQLGSVTYNAMTGGRYTKVGQLVAVIGTIASNAVTLGSPSGNLRIGGLPFTVAAATGSTLNTRGAVVMSNQSNWGTNHTPNNGNIINATTEFDLALLYGNNDDVSSLASTDILTGSNTGANRLFFTVTYMTNA